MINTDIKKQFPFFSKNPGLIYFDNAATTQKPKAVLKTSEHYYNSLNANAGRGSYPLANEVAQKVEEARKKVQRFINAKLPDEIAFTSGATHSLNLVAFGWGFNQLQNGDEILYCPFDHQSAVLPWVNLQKMLKKTNIGIKLVPFKIKPTGDADIDEIISKITPKTRLISLTHISNIYGSDSDISDLINKVKDKNIKVSVDASQSIGHTNVNVQELGADFLSFSGHKMFALLGTGVLYINSRNFSEIGPVFVGGGADQHEKQKLPQLFEPGTQNYAGILSMGAAVDFVESLGIDTIHKHLTELTQYLLMELKKIDSIEFLEGLAFCNCHDGYGLVSFKHKTLSSTEIGFILSENKIYVRTGHHCQTTQNDDTGSIRISMHIYNTKLEIDKLITVLKQI